MKTSSLLTRIGAAALTVGTVAIASGATPVHASGGDGVVEKTGTCSAGSTWKLKAKPDNGQLEVEFEVDSNVVGQMWSVKILDNGTNVFRGSATTVAPSGSFEVNRLIANQAGTDTIKAVATLASTGERCVATLSI